jgi:hypothetical protein
MAEKFGEVRGPQPTVSDTHITCKDIKLLMLKVRKEIFDLTVIVLYEKLVKALEGLGRPLFFAKTENGIGQDNSNDDDKWLLIGYK